MPRPSFSQRLDLRLHGDPRDRVGLESLLRLALSPASFHSPEELRSHLAEGALLDVSVLGSQALSVPDGRYVVWLTDTGRTVLVPTRARPAEVLTRTEDKYEIHTRDLLANWNKLQRCLHEEQPPQPPRRPGKGDKPEETGHQPKQQRQGHFSDAPESRPDGPYTYGSNVDRTDLWSAMQRADIGVSDLADQVGVDKSTISRYLRDPSQGAVEPGGRNPSLGAAQKIASALRVRVDDILPKVDQNEREATSGSGRGGAGSTGRRGNAAYSSGNTE